MQSNRRLWYSLLCSYVSVPTLYIAVPKNSRRKYICICLRSLVYRVCWHVQVKGSLYQEGSGRRTSALGQFENSSSEPLTNLVLGLREKENAAGLDHCGDNFRYITGNSLIVHPLVFLR